MAAVALIDPDRLTDAVKEKVIAAFVVDSSIDAIELASGVPAAVLRRVFAGEAFAQEAMVAKRTQGGGALLWGQVVDTLKRIALEDPSATAVQKLAAIRLLRESFNMDVPAVEEEEPATSYETALRAALAKE